MDKVERLRQLALKRKADRLPRHYCLGDFHDGAYDRHDYVSPWTISAHNVDADLMILLQDWSSSDKLNETLDPDVVAFGHTPSLPTNVRLKSLVKKHFQLGIEETYVTNVFAFIKQGRISATIPMRDMKCSAEKYALPQIEIVQPRLALCVGLQTFNAIRLARGETRVGAAEAAKRPIAVNSTLIYGVPHTGSWGFRNAGGAASVDEIWSGIATKLAAPQAR